MTKAKFIIATICAAVTALLGGWDMLLETLFIFTILDIVTGITLGIAKHELSSAKAQIGFAKKIGIYVMVAIAVRLDGLFGMNEGIRTAVIGFFVATEGLSLVENWAAFGLPIPEKLKAVLKNKE